ncbi:MAG TPA: tail fiber domain-containing protein, partial [Pyrinomonadaceae bacterium]|nr:tail fiber domain-containing protein [Pyrinomonadaceae bacterium]
GKIAKWTSATALGNSIMTENANRIGVNLASPTATLHVNNPTPPAASLNNGVAATMLLQTGGGKGGDTTGTTGQKAGTGAGINLVAGNGGNAPEGSFRGAGGSITLQPGGVGSGAAGTSTNGNVLLAPTGVGNVGIGTTNPASRLTVKSATAANVLEVKDTGVVLISPTAAGFVGIGTTSPSVKLHVIGATTAASKNPVIGGDNTSSGIGTIGHSKSGDGVLGESDGGGNGVKGKSATGPGVLGKSTTGIGVWGQSDSGKAGQFDGPVTIGGLLTANGCNGCGPPSDRSLKANFSSINPRFVLNRLAQIPIQTWNYKSEPGVRHIGAMAQDFHAAFNFGADDHTLSVVDAHGVTMAAIQGLYQQNLELARQVERQGRQIERLQARLNRRRGASRSGRAAK